MTRNSHKSRAISGRSLRRTRLACATGAAALAVMVIGCGKSGNNGGPSPTVGGGGAPSTASTAKAAQDKIAADRALAGATITVAEQNGTIVLTGTVKDQAQKDAAEKDVSDTQTQMQQQVGNMDQLEIGAGSAGGGAGGGQ